ncbi:MAG: dihydropteroate synthase, partial [Chloroflexota bacterium]|nr:dihydropteroate synthase [Chloroflexota bacterium]
MLIIGENIQIISTVVKSAVNSRDKEPLQALAKKMVAHGADVVDLNIGRRKKDGPEVMRWMVDIMQEVIPGVPLSLDTTNAAAIEAGLERCQQLGIEAFVNSISAMEDRISEVMPLVAKYQPNLIALTMTRAGIPVSAEERVTIALEVLLPPVMEAGLPMERLYIDPLILTVKGSQEHAPNAVETIRFLKQGLDPAPRTVVGLSNISNQVPHEGRGLINRTYLVMLLAAGLDAAIADPLDEAQNEIIRIVEERDDSTSVGRLLLALY